MTKKEIEKIHNQTLTAAYARALLAVRAEQMVAALDAVIDREDDAIIQHRLAEVKAECEWVRKNYGGEKQ